MNYGSHHLLRVLLDALPPTPGLLVVLVDNHSSDAERAGVRELSDRADVRLVERANDGFGPAVNAGVREAAAAGAETVLLLNPDVVTDAVTVEALLDDAAAHPDDLVAPVVRDSTGRVVAQGSEVSRSDGRMSRAPLVVPSPAGEDPRAVLGATTEERMPWVTGAALACSVSLFERAGGMATDYFMYWEDVDFSMRVHRAGGALVLRRDLSVRHDEGGTQTPAGGRAKSDLYYYFNCRNRLLFAQHWVGPEQARRWLLQTPAQSRQIWLRGGRRQLLTSPGGAVAAVRGSASGVRAVARTILQGSRR